VGARADGGRDLLGSALPFANINNPGRASMFRLESTLAVSVAALALAACQPMPVYNVADAPVVTTSGKAPSATQVRSAIITAGTSLGWTIKDAGPGRLEGTLRLREHTAVVEIPYSGARYSITYKSSENLMAADGKIHKNYNGWIQNLDRAIRTEISRI
jgi:hypothetical protein